MKSQTAPVEISDLMPFSSSLNSSYASNAPKATFSGISNNGLWMWIVSDTAINIYHTENSEWFGGYCFGESLKDSSAKVTAVVEFRSSHISFPCLLIAVNHNHESLICMLDINVSKVVRAVLVPDKVHSLEVISGNGGACMETHHLFVQIRYMFGIVALGTCTGHLYFLDLCLDEDFPSNEVLPNITCVLKKYELLPEHREMAISKQQHVLMLLNDQSTRNDCFEFESRSSSLGHFPHSKVQVTALKYIQNTVTLAVGFNFGGIQLWDLQDLCLLYTVAKQPQEQPIIAFAFQEPENDPRHFCYLWIIRGHLANEKPEDFSVATMYSLIYGRKTYDESFGTLYTDLRNCTKRFEYRLTSDPYSSAQSSSAAGSCLVSCQTVCQTDENHYMEASSANESDTAAENMSLCFLSWLVWSSVDNYPSSYHLAVFDLNQWYRAEMPSSNLRCDPSYLNPYFAHFSLDEAAQIFDLEPILGVYGIPHSIKKLKFISPSEEFFYPSSLDFRTVLFSTNGICKATFLGLQKRLLYGIADLAPNVLVNPKDFYSDLIHSGLISDVHSTSERIPLIVQREAILQLALEYHMSFLFMKCLKEWRYADSIQEGCTSRALVNWAWKKVMHIKNSIDRLSIPLFNCSGCDIDKASLKCLYSYKRQLDLIDTIFMGYQKFAAPRTEQGVQELKCRKDVVFCINMYLQVLLWLRSVHVLPEVCEGEETDKNVLYPVNALLNSYHKRRSLLQKIHYSIGSTDILLIDGLVKEAFSENTWQEKGGNGIYPPPSIYAALSCYLLDDVHLELKHSFMYYILLDVCNAPSNLNSPFLVEVKKFPVVFEMTHSVTKLVEAFWYLDQFNFEVAIKKLLHPAVKSADILPWQHHRVIKSFLFQKEAQKALKYINHLDPPENTIEDMKLHLSVLLSRGSITQAFDYQRSKQSEGFGKDLLHHLFLGCQETHRLKDLMYLPLNVLESSALIKFLSENEDPRAQEALVMYYLLHCNFFEAAKINEKLSTSITGKSGSTRKRTAGRDALVEGLLASVPKTEKNLVEEINRFHSLCDPVKRGENLKPLSLSVKSAPMKQITYSDILNSLISEASSVTCANYLEPQTPLRSGCFRSKSYFDNIPFLRPPLTPEYARMPSETVYSTPVAKRTLTSPTSEFSSPSKKSRLLDNVPFKTSSLSKKKIPKHLAGDIASLLQSPPIHRRGSKPFKDGVIRDSPITAPQGILKKKVELPKFPMSDVYTARTPSVLSDAGENSDDEDAENEKMVVDEEPDDIPGRQIRFSVPSKDSFNASRLSLDSEAPENNEMSITDVSKEPSSFIKKLDDLKMPSLETFSSTSKELINVTHRRTLQTLTREPLKAYSKQSPEKKFPDLVSNEQPYAQPSGLVEKASYSSDISQQLSQQKVVTESECVDISDSDSSPAVENAGEKSEILEVVETVKDDSEVSFVPSSFCINSPTPLEHNLKEKESENQPSLNAEGDESVLNISGSSGNSSYNSASERSFVITPRRPLRDNLKNTSNFDNSFLSAVERKKDETLLGSEVRNSDDDDDNDVSIIGEVSVSPSKDVESVGNITGECSAHKLTLHQITTKSIQETDKQLTVSETQIKGIENTAATSDDTSYDVEVIENNQNSSSGDKNLNTFIHSDQSVECIEDLNENTETATLEEEKTENADVIVNTAEEVIELIEKQVVESIELSLQDVHVSSTDNVSGLFTKDSSESPLIKTSESPVKNVLESFDKNCSESPVSNISEPPVKNVSESPEKDREMFDLTEVAPVPCVSTYVPIKERIKFSHASDSEFIKDDDDGDDIYPALLIKEQMEYEVFEQKEDVLQKQPKVAESIEKSEDVPDSSKVIGVETETQEAQSVMDFSTFYASEPFQFFTPTSAQKFSERCSFLSRHSDVYENKKLHRETMQCLKETETAIKFDYNPEKKSRKTKTYIFEKEEKVETLTTDLKSSRPRDEASWSEKEKVETVTTGPKSSKSEDGHFKIRDESSSSSKGFLESWHPETYEQFSYSIQKGKSKDGEKKNLKSSPNTALEKSSLSLFDESSVSVQSASGVRGRNKKHESSKKDTSVDKRQRSTIKKAKDKSRVTKKIEFSFAEPHSPAGPEILEALTTPSEYPVGSFMFSPPLTRGRLRQKRMDETLGSSFASVASDTSYVQAKKPPVDPILEGIMTEKAPESKELTGSAIKTGAKSSPRKKSASKKATRADLSKSKIVDTSADTSKLVDETEEMSQSKVLSSLKYAPVHNPKHKMVLRQAKSKSRTKQLFF